jgi:hypothetical protein
MAGPERIKPVTSESAESTSAKVRRPACEMKLRELKRRRHEGEYTVRRKHDPALNLTTINRDPSKGWPDHPERTMQTAQTHPSKGRSLEMMTPAAAAHWQRCRGLPPMQPGEADRLIADFLAAKSITACPTRYAAPIEQRPQFSRTGTDDAPV